MAICQNCGKALPDDARFCLNCGKPVTAEGEPRGSARPAEADAGAEPQDTGDVGPVERKRPAAPRKKRLPLLIVVLAIAACLVLFFTLGRDGGGSGAEDARRRAVSAFYDEDGDAWIPCADGTCVRIKDEIRTASLTPDGKRAVVLTEDGELYAAGKDLSGKTGLETKAASFRTVSRSGFFYEANDRLYRYSFSRGSTVKLGSEIAGIVYSDDGSGVLYVRDGKLFCLPGGAEEPERLAGGESVIRPLFFSDDGKTAIWGEETEKGYTVMLWEKGEKRKLGRVDGESIRASGSRDRKLFVFSGYGDTGCILLWEQGWEDAVRVRLEADWDGEVYTENGRLSGSSAEEGKALYLSASDEGGRCVYKVTLDGDREQILSRVSEWTVADGRILWTRGDGTLLCGRLREGKIAEETELDGEVRRLWITGGDHLYYVKGESAGECSLYCWKSGEKAPVEVDSEVFGSYGFFSLNGDMVVYLKDMDPDRNTGDLMLWTWGGLPVRLAGDAVIWGADSGYSDRHLDPDAFWFLADAEGDRGDLYFWNGREKKKLASDIDLGRIAY